MDNTILKKRLNTFRSTKTGRLKDVSKDLTLDVLRAWEIWPGSAKDFYQSLGLVKHQLSSIIKKGKNLVKSGVVVESEFKEINFDGVAVQNTNPCQGIELVWDGGKLIRFGRVEELVDFFKKVA